MSEAHPITFRLKAFNAWRRGNEAPQPDPKTVGEDIDSICDIAKRLEIERDEWKQKFIQQNKDLGCEMMDPNGTIWDYAKKLQEENKALQEHLSAERALADRLAEELEKLAWLAGHEVPNEAEKALTAWKEARSEV